MPPGGALRGPGKRVPAGRSVVSHKLFAIWARVSQSLVMTQPLALVLYEKLLPGTQLVNRLQDLGYRVHPISTVEGLAACAEQVKPMLVLADLYTTRGSVVDVIGQLRKNSATTHLPVIAFAEEKEAALQESARQAGATLVVNDAALLAHLESFLEQALRLD